MNRTMRILHIGTLAGALAVSSACSSLTKVSAPDISQPTAFQNPAGAATRAVGALVMFYSEYGLWVQQSGLLTDELTSLVPGFTALTSDTRVLPDGGPTSPPGYGYPGQRTRVDALQAIGLLEQFAPAPASRIGELFAVVGSMETVMAEDMCSGVPLATLVNGNPVPGPATTTATLYANALAQFDSAARYAADSARVLNFAKIGRARALLDLDSASAAAQMVSGIPTSYMYQALFSATTTQVNPLAQAGFQTGNAAVSNREGINGLPFVSTNDPRVPIDSSKGVGSDGVTPWYIFVPYLNVGAPITIASGVEARLIEAEAALVNHDAVTWLAKLNALRVDSSETGIHGLTPLADPVSDTARVSLMFSERAFWLFLTGHRQGDLRRLIRQYGRTQDHVFPTGLYKQTGQQYGTDVTFPVTGDNVDSTRPECLDRNP